MTILQKSYNFELPYFLDYNPTDILQFLMMITYSPSVSWSWICISIWFFIPHRATIRELHGVQEERNPPPAPLHDFSALFR